MKKLLLFVSVVVCVGPSFSQLKIDKKYYVNLLNDGKFSLVYDSMKQIQKRPYGKCCLTDYFIAKTLCLSNLPDKADKRYNDILTNYKLTQPAKAFITEERSQCQASEEVANDGLFTYINNYTLPTSSVHGKLGVVYNCAQSYAPVKVIRDIPEDDLYARIYPVADSQKAVNKIKSIVPSTYAVEKKGNFILVTLKNQGIKSSTKDSVVKELQKTLNFYTRFYGLTSPGKLITAYIVPNNVSLREIASKVHGLEIPKENYGYSTLSDLSIAGISNAIGVGTLKHELFHIVVRADVGNIPAWLDEGIATLYEESSWSGDTLKGNKTFWRNKTLRDALEGAQLYSKLPDMETLINYSWLEFDGTDDGDICEASVNYALAKHIVVWLQETGRLKVMLDAYRYKTTDYKTDEGKSNVQVFNEVMGMPLSKTEQQFDNWLSSEYSGLSTLKPHLDGPYEARAIVDLKKGLQQARSIVATLSTTNKQAAKDLTSVIERTDSSLKMLGRRLDNDVQKIFDKYPDRYKREEEVTYLLDTYSRSVMALKKQFDEEMRRFR